ncbi:cytochrome P450 [Coniophora puteana RWD-64-598 SS2]|uniref:Cytochrome P450 n=1 Tax=Coniophora puteana (strain RWD-64-598) TaxID=741705 RepID=A0A5M3MZ75_CONPW|nr:cytochrome P450 [Coniophora puteana RWD-64-598 SS2]EIW84448.1 cytochrome P450 [Coniophora puteana RWD-64-598 SS2]
MASPLFLLAVAAPIAGALIAIAKAYRNVRSKGCPPGPKPLPLLGCALQVDATQPWLTYTEWKDTYGDIVYCPTFGQDTIVVNSEEMAQDLFDKRSSNYSDRMDASILTKYFGMGHHTAIMRHNDVWREHRRVMQQGLRREPVKVYLPVQLRRAHDLIKSLRKSPTDYCRHVKRFSGATILEVVYDHRVGSRGEEDPILKRISDANDVGVLALAPGNILRLSVFPFLRHIPTWLSGGQLDSAVCRKHMETMVEVPYSELKHKLASGYAAGEDTTGSTLMIFILAMALYPEVQTRAQSEIDSVVGSGRLPSFDDWETLPYVEAVFRETLRWYPVVPLGVPHAASREDVYRGYHIPKGAVVVPNVWAMTRDPDKYHSPADFKPERFLDEQGNLTSDEVDYVFGFGRRICPGRYLAKASVWVAMACILASLRIEKAKDVDGRPIEPKPEWVHGITS